MDNIYMLDYIGMLMLRAGYFTHGDDAMQWVKDNDPERESSYSLVLIAPARREGLTDLHYNRRYAYQS